MKRFKRTKYVLLGLLAKRPMSGYDIKKFIDEAVHYFWNESYGQIYPMLRSFVTEGLATVETVIQEGKPDRNIYAITQKGTEELVAWLKLPAEEMPVRLEFLLKLYFGSEVGTEKTIENLHSFKQEQQAKLETYHQIQDHIREACEDQPEKVFSLSTVLFGIRECQMRLAWADETIEMLQKQQNHKKKPIRA